MLNKEQIDQLELEPAETALAKCLKNKDIDRSLIKYTELWPQVDDLANEICRLEDRIAYLKQLQNLEKANAARWAKE